MISYDCFSYGLIQSSRQVAWYIESKTFTSMMPCRVEIRLVCREWRSMSEMPQLWRSVAMSWFKSSHCNDERLSNLGSITRFFTRYSALQELSIEFTAVQSIVVSELIIALGRSASLTKLCLKSFSSSLAENKEIEKAGLLMSCAIARLSTLQSLDYYGLPVESLSSKPAHIQAHLSDTIPDKTFRLEFLLLSFVDG